MDNYSDLSDILTANNQYTKIILGSDIVMSSGIQIHNNRALAIIDGEYPIGSGIFHSLTDADSNYGMIYKNNISALDITFQNMVIYGRNYYGMPRIANGNTEVNVYYRNVIYTGPQITWHWSGLTQYIDCDITIVRTGSSPVQEIGEVCRVEIGGTTNIRHTGSGYSCFYFYKSNSSLTILENSVVNISTEYDFFYNEYSTKFIVENNAYFKVQTSRGMSRSASHCVSSFLVDENASFIYIQEGNSEGNAALYINEAFNIERNSTVYMEANFASTSSSRRIIQFTSNSSARGLYVNHPKSFILYNLGIGTDIYFSATTPFSFSCGQINFWRDATPFDAIPPAGSSGDIPLYKWNKTDWSGFEISGEATASNTTVLSSDLPTPVDPDLANLQLHSARVLSIGEMPLSLDPIIIETNTVSGDSEVDSFIHVSYIYQTYSRDIDTFADDSGHFSVATEYREKIAFGTEMKVVSNIPFLTSTLIGKARYSDDLHIEAPTSVVFLPKPIQYDPVIFPRFSVLPGFATVYDVRDDRTPWEVYLSISAPLQTGDGDELEDAVIYVLDSGEVKTLYTDSEQLIVENDEREEITPIPWDNDKGLLARITSVMKSGKKYMTTLNWHLNPIDEEGDG